MKLYKSFRILILMSCVLASASVFADDADDKQAEKHYTSEEIANIAMGVANKNFAKQDLIENKLKACQSAHGDTIGISNCMRIAYKEYEQILQHLYKAARTHVTPETLPDFDASQQHWEAFRESYRKVNVNDGDRGTIFPLQSGQVNLDQIKQRINEFALYLELSPV